MTVNDPWLSDRLRKETAVRKGELSIRGAAAKALRILTSAIRNALGKNGTELNTKIMDARAPGWRDNFVTQIIPSVQDAFGAGFREVLDNADVTPDRYVTEHLATVKNRLVGVADDVFNSVTHQIEEGRQAGESVDQIGRRIDTVLADAGAETWTSRGGVIARTETIGAYNAGQEQGAHQFAGLLGVAPEDVEKTWQATADAKTRPTHQEADGQTVRLTDRFHVGADHLARPGDPEGSPEEVIQCRCSLGFRFPGDPGYALTAAGAPLADEDTACLDCWSTTGQTFDVSTMPPKLQEFWIHGKGAALIGWGTPGSYTRCTKVLGHYLPIEMIHGACASLYHEATGMWPGKHHDTTVGAAANSLVADAGDPGDNTLCVMALPAPGQDVHLIGPEQKHATLIYYGDPTVPGNPDPGLVHQAVAKAASLIAPFTERVTEQTQLGADGEAEVWALNPAGGLAAVRDHLMETDSEMVPAEQTYPTYLPHVTIGYPDDAPEDGPDDGWDTILDAASDINSITFDRLAVWHGPDQTEYPLMSSSGAQPVENPVQSDDRNTEATVGADVSRETDPMYAPWYSVLTMESPIVGQNRTGDGREIAYDALDSRDLPLPLMMQDAQAPGHEGAVRTGRIDGIGRWPDGRIVGVGVWDIHPTAIEAHRQVGAQMLRGVSVDLDNVTAEFIDGDTGERLDTSVPPPDGTYPVMRTVEARIAGATLCSIPAFAEAFIANGEPPPGFMPPDALYAPDPQAPPQAVEQVYPSLVASAGSGTPAAWLQDPELDGPTRFTITDDGEVFGHLAAWGVCHITFANQCVLAPTSHTNYAYFATGSLLANGAEDRMPVGQITMGTGHAPEHLGHRPAAAHYDDMGSAVCDIAIGEDKWGIWFHGAMRPDVTPGEIEALRAAGSVSGDWRKIGGNLELVGVLAVNVPGFPIPPPRSYSEHGEQMALVAAGVLAPAKPATGDLSPAEFADMTGWTPQTFARAVVAEQDRIYRNRERAAAVHRSFLSARADRTARFMFNPDGPSAPAPKPNAAHPQAGDGGKRAGKTPAQAKPGGGGDFDSKHPRGSAGTPEGGRFVPKGGGAGGGSSAPTAAEKAVAAPKGTGHKGKGHSAAKKAATAKAKANAKVTANQHKAQAAARAAEAQKTKTSAHNSFVNKVASALQGLNSNGPMPAAARALIAKIKADAAAYQGGDTGSGGSGNGGGAGAILASVRTLIRMYGDSVDKPTLNRLNDAVRVLSQVSLDQVHFTMLDSRADMIGTFISAPWMKQRRTPKGHGIISGRWLDMLSMPLSDNTLRDMQGGSGEAHLQPFPDAPGQFQFTPERQAFHDSFITAAMTGLVPAEGRNPRYTIMGGGPASGKSSLIGKYRGTDRDVETGRALINADIAKTGADEGRPDIPGIPEYAAKVKAGDLTAAGFAHEESSYMASALAQAALDGNYDATLDGTGDSSLNKMQRKINQARSKGYEVEGLYVTVPTEEALLRANLRGQRNGRFVPAPTIVGTHVGVSDTVPELLRLRSYDRFELWDNSGDGDPVLIAEHPDSTFKGEPADQWIAPPRIARPDLYDAFLAKSNDTPAAAAGRAAQLATSRAGVETDPVKRAQLVTAAKMLGDEAAALQAAQDAAAKATG